MDIDLPFVKKKISSFLLGEEGQISKKAIIGLGIALAGVAVQTAMASHCSCSCTSQCGAQCGAHCGNEGGGGCTCDTQCNGVTADCNDNCGQVYWCSPDGCSDECNYVGCNYQCITVGNSCSNVCADVLCSLECACQDYTCGKECCNLGC